MTGTDLRSPLDAAREHLRARSNIEDERWVDALYDVADMTCRVGDHGDQPHYQVEKACTLVRAAVNVRGALFERYDPGNDDAYFEASDLVKDVESAVAAVMWSLRNGVSRQTARELVGAAAALTQWADRVAAGAVDDDEL